MHRSIHIFILVAVSTSCMWSTTQDANACTLIDVPPFDLDDTARATMPPDAPVLQLETIERATGPIDLGDGVSGVDTCTSYTTFISLKVLNPGDDLGYIMEVTRGPSPYAEDTMGSPLHLLQGEYVGRMYWREDAGGYEDELDHWVTVTAINAQGIKSAPSEAVHIYHPGQPAREVLQDQEEQAKEELPVDEMSNQDNGSLDEDDPSCASSSPAVPVHAPAPLLLFGLLVMGLARIRRRHDVA